MNYELNLISTSKNEIRDSDSRSSSSSNNSAKELARNKSAEFKIQPTDESYIRMRKTVFYVLTDPNFGLAGRLTSIFLTSTIIWCAISFSLETVWTLNKTPAEFTVWKYNEILISVIFTLEYFLRILFFPSYRWLPSYLFSVSWMIDFITTLPFYLTLFVEDTSSSFLGIIRLTRVLRMIRLLKISQHTMQVAMVFEALKRSRDAVLMLIFLISNCLFLYGSCIYFAELSISTRDDTTGIITYTSGQLNGRASKFQSIPDSMWWAMVTLTTVIKIYLGWVRRYGPNELLGQIYSRIHHVYGFTRCGIPNYDIKYEHDGALRRIQSQVFCQTTNSRYKVTGHFEIAGQSIWPAQYSFAGTSRSFENNVGRSH